MRYPIVIHKDQDSDYGVTVPDLPGCFSAGKSFDEAMDSAREAIECHVEGLLIDGDDIPNAIPIEEHQNNPDFADGTWAFVQVDLSKLSGKSKRLNITVPERIVERIDRYAQQSGDTRSGLITTATMAYIAAHPPTSREEISAHISSPERSQGSNFGNFVITTPLPRAPKNVEDKMTCG